MLFIKLQNSLTIPTGEFITTDVVSSNSVQARVLDTKLCATGQWFSPGTQISSTNKTDRHDITHILLKVALTTIAIDITQKGGNQKPQVKGQTIQ